MIVIHGDYKDLNFTKNYGTKPTADEGHLLPLWDRFVKCGLNLEEKRIFTDDYFNCNKIFITHYVFDTNCYTAYSVVGITKERIGGYLEHCKGFDRKFIDRENNVLVLEQTILHGIVPANLEELKQRQITDITASINRFKESIKNNEDQQMKNAYIRIIRDFQKSILKWKNKTSVRWFY